MSLGEYLIVLAVGVGIVAVGALPLLIPWLLTFFSKRLQSKRRFVAVSGALSYGFTCFIGLLLLPFFLLGSWVSAELDVDGHSDLAFALDVVVKYSVYVLLNAALVFAVAVPVYLRRKWSTSPK
jgi:MFS family permease